MTPEERAEKIKANLLSLVVDCINEAGVDGVGLVHVQGAIDKLDVDSEIRAAVKEERAATIRELDAKYNALCEKKVVKEFEHAAKIVEKCVKGYPQDVLDAIDEIRARAKELSGNSGEVEIRARAKEIK